MNTTIKLEGAKELEEALKELTAAGARAAMRRALRAGGAPLAARMNALAPDGGTSPDGPLNDSYSVSTKLNRRQSRAQRRTGKDEVFMYVGTSDVAGIQQEFGNRNHAAQPHVRPAWDTGKTQVLTDTLGAAEVEVEKAVARARRKAARKA